MRSGFSISDASAFHVCNSTVPICAVPTSASTDSIVRSGGWPGSMPGCCVIFGIASFALCFWKNSSPPMSSGARTSDTGRSFRCGSIQSATDS